MKSLVYFSFYTSFVTVFYRHYLFIFVIVCSCRVLILLTGLLSVLLEAVDSRRLLLDHWTRNWNKEYKHTPTFDIAGILPSIYISTFVVCTGQPILYWWLLHILLENNPNSQAGCAHKSHYYIIPCNLHTVRSKLTFMPSHGLLLSQNWREVKKRRKSHDLVINHHHQVGKIPRFGCRWL